MNRELKIDKAIYIVDDATRTYRFLRRNVGWKSLDPEENEANKKRLNGYRRIFRAYQSLQKRIGNSLRKTGGFNILLKIRNLLPIYFLGNEG